MKKQTKSKKHFYQKKPFWLTIGSVVGFVLIILIWFRLSPLPGALIIRAVFSQNTDKVLSALEKHQPSVPITTLANQSYRHDDKDAVLDVYYPSNVQNTTTRLPVIIWTHGGAWVSGDKANTGPYFKLLAAQGFTVIAVNYSLAPEHTYPTPIHQLNDVYAYVQQNAGHLHADTNKIVLAGDSAGSQLTSEMAAIVTNPAYANEVGVTPNLQPAQLRGVVLNCGIYQMSGLTQPDPTLPKIIGWGDDVSVWAYSGNKNFSSNPLIRQMSAYYHVTNQFPPTFITGGNADPLTTAQSMPFAAKLQSLDVSVTELFYAKDHTPALPHEYQFNLDNADGAHALQAITDFAKAQTQ
ncbi:MAG TPA: alpha/beta hydrolase [Candidatus Saccharimonadales bacterium]|jgi:acetyl esterase/lipase|nr:alpha/beta hydrolase [Candidatus Saccharimonadales bacterium]